MVHPEEDKNRQLHQNRPRPAGPATGAPLPYPGELVGKKEPPYDVTGVDALSPLLMHVEFPATRDEIQRAIGQAVIPIDRHRTRSVAEVLDHVGPDTFRSSREVEDAVNRYWDQIAERTGRGGRQQKGDNLGGRPPN